jgi:hypothetical protein
MKLSDKLNGWDGAIADVEKHIECLRGSILACEEKKAKGEPWPGSEKQSGPQVAKEG